MNRNNKPGMIYRKHEARLALETKNFCIITDQKNIKTK